MHYNSFQSNKKGNKFFNWNEKLKTVGVKILINEPTKCEHFEKHEMVLILRQNIAGCIDFSTG